MKQRAQKKYKVLRNGFLTHLVRLKCSSVNGTCGTYEQEIIYCFTCQKSLTPVNKKDWAPVFVRFNHLQRKYKNSWKSLFNWDVGFPFFLLETMLLSWSLISRILQKPNGFCLQKNDGKYIDWRQKEMVGKMHKMI